MSSIAKPTLWGPHRLGAASTRFRLWAPSRDAVTLEIDGRDGQPMARTHDGWFEAEAPVGAGARYRFRLTHDQVAPDPAARAQTGGPDGWSVVVDEDAYRWRTPDWRGRPWEAAVIYEVHPGLYDGFKGIEARLPALADLGVTAIELMPVNTVSGARNWGYDGVLPYAPAEAYGTPDALKSLVDKAHALGLMVLLDVVYNHFGPDGNLLPAYAEPFFDPEKQTPWGAAIAFDREEVARYFIDNARMWIETYRFDGLRFDAVHAMKADSFLDRMAAEIRDGAGDRPVHLVLENEGNDAARLAPARFDAQWNDDFHNVLHVLLTGETQSYYRDFADRPAERLARCLSEGFIYQGEPSPNHNGAPRGSPSAVLPPTRFVSFLQNHDQVGNRALGERLTTLVAPEKLKAAVAMLLLCPQIPLLFMGEEDDSETPFLFFTDFHDELADAVRSGRRKEFADVSAFADPQAREAIPDPNAPETFEASRPQPGPQAEAWRTLYRDLLALRRDQIVPRLAGARSASAEVIGDKAVMARWTLGDGATLTLALNLGDAPASCAAPQTVPAYVVGDGWSDGALSPHTLAAWIA